MKIALPGFGFVARFYSESFVAQFIALPNHLYESTVAACPHAINIYIAEKKPANTKRDAI